MYCRVRVLTAFIYLPVCRVTFYTRAYITQQIHEHIQDVLLLFKAWFIFVLKRRNKTYLSFEFVVQPDYELYSHRKVMSMYPLEKSYDSKSLARQQDYLRIVSHQNVPHL